MHLMIKGTSMIYNNNNSFFNRLDICTVLPDSDINHIVNRFDLVVC